MLLMPLMISASYLRRRFSERIKSQVGVYNQGNAILLSWASVLLPVNAGTGVSVLDSVYVHMASTMYVTKFLGRFMLAITT